VFFQELIQQHPPLFRGMMAGSADPAQQSATVVEIRPFRGG
jgi:hypothetical protein